jgi:hypothetical protein
VALLRLIQLLAELDGSQLVTQIHAQSVMITNSAVRFNLVPRSTVRLANILSKIKESFTLLPEPVPLLVMALPWVVHTLVISVLLASYAQEMHPKKNVLELEALLNTL